MGFVQEPTHDEVVLSPAPMFASAEAYERYMGRWSRKLAPLFARFAAVGDGDTVLDLGSGTGALTAAVARIAPLSRIIGVDASAPYVDFARQRHAGDFIRFEVGDARQLRFRDGSFDRTLSLLALNFVPDSRKALDEMIRVTRPGGVVAAAIWDYGSAMRMLHIFWDEASALNARDDARDERQMPHCRRGELAELWREHFLDEVTEKALSIRMAFSSFDDYWLPFLEEQGPAGAFVADLPALKRDELRDRLRRRLLGLRRDGRIAMSARAWAVRGIKRGFNG